MSEIYRSSTTKESSTEPVLRDWDKLERHRRMYIAMLLDGIGSDVKDILNDTSYHYKNIYKLPGDPGLLVISGEEETEDEENERICKAFACMFEDDIPKRMSSLRDFLILAYRNDKALDALRICEILANLIKNDHNNMINFRNEDVMASQTAKILSELKDLIWSWSNEFGDELTMELLEVIEEIEIPGKRTCHEARDYNEYDDFADGLR